MSALALRKWRKWWQNDVYQWDQSKVFRMTSPGRSWVTWQDPFTHTHTHGRSCSFVTGVSSPLADVDDETNSGGGKHRIIAVIVGWFDYSWSWLCSRSNALDWISTVGARRWLEASVMESPGRDPLASRAPRNRKRTDGESIYQVSVSTSAALKGCQTEIEKEIGGQRDGAQFCSIQSPNVRRGESRSRLYFFFRPDRQKHFSFLPSITYS